MPQCIKQLMLGDDYPDLPLVGQSVIRIPFLPEEVSTPEGKADFQDEFNRLAANVGRKFHHDLKVEVHVKEGSLILDVFFNCELSVLLSMDNLKALGMLSDSPVWRGVEKGTELYVAIVTCRSIRRLEGKMRDFCRTFKKYALMRFDAMGPLVSGKGASADELSGWGEARGGILGMLARLFDAVDVCRGSADLARRVTRMRQVHNTVKTLDAAIIRQEDRDFLCGLILPLVRTIGEAKPSGDNVEADVAAFNEARQKTMDIMSKLCHRPV